LTGYEGFLDLSYKPEKDDLVVEFYVEPNRVDIYKAANAIAGESSIGTWTDVKTMEKRISKTLKPTVFNIKGHYIKVAYPSRLFEKGNMAEILSSIAGNIFGMKILKNLRIEGIDWPNNIIKSYKGPKYGISGIRKILGVKKRPLVGTIVKPKLGLTWKKHAKVAYEAWMGGCDIVKDDENLTSQIFNPFNKRIIETLKMRRQAERETGEVKVYMPNVTAEVDEMRKRARFVKKHGGRYMMIDVVTTGFSALQTMRKENDKLGLVIHAHRAMHAALTRGKMGISMFALAEIYRLLGVDQLHIGTIVGKMEGGKEEVIDIKNEISKTFVKPKKHVLENNWGKIKSVFPVSSGGLHPGHVDKLIKYLGKDIIIQMGGGIHGHPLGTLQGARAAREAVDAIMKGKSLKEYAKKHIALNMALKHFGTK
jgi:ribulose-bisphosphate carboxylase large chain